MNSLEPAKSLTVTSAFVALVRTAAFELASAVLRNSINARRDRPAIPNSATAWSIHVTASAKTLGAFCFDSGSYADRKQSAENTARRYCLLTVSKNELKGRLFREKRKGFTGGFLEFHVA